MLSKVIPFGPVHFQCYAKEDDIDKYDSLDFRLKFLLCIYVLFLRSNNVYNLTFTDFDTPGIHKTLCHYEHRAVDVCLPNKSLALAVQFAQMVNANVDFGQGLHPIVVGEIDPEGSHNNHIHFQVPHPYKQSGMISLVT